MELRSTSATRDLDLRITGGCHGRCERIRDRRGTRESNHPRVSPDRPPGTTSVQIVRSNVTAIAVEPRTTEARTGDVVRFSAKISVDSGAPPAVRWSVTGAGATIDADGGFVAERPGSHVVTASVGERSSIATVTVTPTRRRPAAGSRRSDTARRVPDHGAMDRRQVRLCDLDRRRPSLGIRYLESRRAR